MSFSVKIATFEIGDKLSFTTVIFQLFAELLVISNLGHTKYLNCAKVRWPS